MTKQEIRSEIDRLEELYLTVDTLGEKHDIDVRLEQLESYLLDLEFEE
jgi:hypothetical protein